MEESDDYQEDNFIDEFILSDKNTGYIDEKF